MAGCFDCGLPYDDPGFADLIVTDAVWLKISPTGHGGGLLCPTCLVRRAAAAGVAGETAAFRSGPFCDAAHTALWGAVAEVLDMFDRGTTGKAWQIAMMRLRTAASRAQ